MVGKKHENRFYPEISGVAKSYNFYPVKPQKSHDGIVSVALGLGKTVVDGGSCLRFCPKYPQDIIQFNSVKDTLDNSQTKFYALQLDGEVDLEVQTHDLLLKEYDLEVAEKDEALNLIGSTYSIENDIIYDGTSRQGIRVVTFAPILKHKIFPLPEIMNFLLNISSWGMGTPVEIEFAVNLANKKHPINEFGVVQDRPIVINEELENFKIEHTKKENLLCESDQVLGHGIINDIHDIVYVDYDKFNRAKSVQIAQEVNYFNSKLNRKNRPYLLIGMGRWGSLDPWLGIPVVWEQISGAKVIVESDFKDIVVMPSQGSHFFHNITSLMIGYFTVSNLNEKSFLDFDWLRSLTPVEQKKYCTHISFTNPLIVKINGRNNKGIILKPEENKQTAE